MTHTDLSTVSQLIAKDAARKLARRERLEEEKFAAEAAQPSWTPEGDPCDDCGCIAYHETKGGHGMWPPELQCSRCRAWCS